jgi:hypothetical protein
MIQEWSLLLSAIAFIVWIVTTAGLSVHTQKRLAEANERDSLVDVFVWVNRRTSWLRH